jgi:tetratricopeptide (TPR) repeat protein
MILMRLLRQFGLIFAVWLGALAPTSAAERVAVRVGEHPGFSRLVFDWGGPVGVRLEQKPGQATVYFDRAEELDLARFKADPPPGIAKITVTPNESPKGGPVTPGIAVTITLTDEYKARLLEVDGVIVVDALKPGTPLDAPPAKPTKKQTKQKTEKAKVSGKPVVSKKVPQPKPKPQNKPQSKPAPEPGPAQTTAKPVTEPAPLAPGQVIAVPLPSLSPEQSDGPILLLPPAGPSPDEITAAARAKQEVAARKAVAATVPVPRGRPLRRPPSVKPSRSDLDARAAAKAAAKVKKPSVTRPTGVSSDSPPISIDTATAPARSIDRGAPVPLRFDWPVQVAAAAYRRGASLWLAFDRPLSRDLTIVLKQLIPQFGPYKQYSLGGGTLIRISVPPVLVPQMRKEGMAWIVDLWSADRAEGPNIEAAVDGGVQPATISFAMPDAGRVMSFVDPELGDRLIVVPVTSAGRGLVQSRDFPQFRALSTYQGLAIQPLSNGTELTLAEGSVRIRDDGGLAISYGANLALLQSNISTPPNGPRLLDPEAWRRGGQGEFLANKQALQKALSEAPPEERGVARMDLARLYFGNGLLAESLGVLRLREAEDPRLAMDPQSRLMKGISEFLIDDFENAAKDLFAPSLEGEWEAVLWHAAYAAASLDWGLAARRFARAEPLIPSYLHTIRTRLRLLAAEANLGIADTVAADRYLRQIRDDSPTRAEEAQVAFLVGRRLQLEGKTKDAVAIWERVLTSRDPASVTRARVALLDVGMENGTISPEEAVQELERLRFAWRGDRFEFALLQRLGDLYISLYDYRAGLRALRQAASYFPASERSQMVAQRMRDVFYDIYLGKTAKKIPPLRALAMYEEFKELTPPGARGDKVIASLVERLVDVDLLGRAAELLTAQIKYRLDGVEKARAGMRLAMIRLLHRAPGKAIEAIAMSSSPKLPSDLVRERRYLRVRALTQLGRYESALNELGRDDNPAALRLRADILWANRDWPAAALALGRLVPPAPPKDKPFSKDDSRTVVDLAVALTLAGEREKLRTLGKAYRKAMQGQPAGQTFALLIGGLQAGASKSIAEELAQVAQAEAFMASYRERLRQQQASAPQ